MQKVASFYSQQLQGHQPIKQSLGNLCNLVPIEHPGRKKMTAISRRKGGHHLRQFWVPDLRSPGALGRHIHPISYQGARGRQAVHPMWVEVPSWR